MASFPSLLSQAFRQGGEGAASARQVFPNPATLLKFFGGPSPVPREDPHAADVAVMVESEIIPRLMLAHRIAPVAAETDVEQGGALDAATTESFAKMVLSQESESLMVFVGGLLQAGRSMESIYVDLLAPAARLLGDYWSDDRISFTDVTIGLGRLQQVVRTLGWSKPHDVEGDDDGGSRSAYFVPTGGEQHTFGLFIVEDYFRRAGWRTWIETSTDDEDATAAVGSHWFDVLGLSASREAQVEPLTTTISAIRRASRNPKLFVLVGGRLFIERPELVAIVGADATAPTGGEALLVADNAVMRLASPL